MQMREFYMFHFVESLESLNVLTNPLTCIFFFAWWSFQLATYPGTYWAGTHSAVHLVLTGLVTAIAQSPSTQWWALAALKSHAIPAQLCAWSGTEWDHWESCTAAIWGSTHHCQVLLVTSQLTAEMLPTSYIPERVDTNLLFTMETRLVSNHSRTIARVLRDMENAATYFPDSVKGQINTIIHMFNNIYWAHYVSSVLDAGNTAGYKWSF